jgi:transposase
MKGVVFDFAESRGGRHAHAFLGDWRGTLVCEDYSGYKALFTMGVTEAGCMAHYLESNVIWSSRREWRVCEASA